MKDYYLNNPVGRLFIIIEKIKSSKGSSTIGDNLKNVFSIGKENPLGLYECIEIFLKLIQEVEDILVEMNMDEDLWKECIVNIKKSVQGNIINLSNGSANLINAIPDSILVALRHIASTVSKEQPRKYIPGKELADLKTLIVNLRENISKSNLDPKLKLALENHFLYVERMIIEYQMFGNEILDKILKDAFSTTAFHVETIREDKGITDKLFEYINKINSLSKLYSNILIYGPQIGNTIRSLLPG